MAIIRDAKIKDLEHINTILEINEQLSDVTEDDIKDFVVAVVDGKVVGCGMLKEHENSVEITRVSVLPSDQGKGLGMEITMTLLGRAEGKRCWLVSVKSHDFWNNFGFRIVPDEMAPREAKETCERCGRKYDCKRVIMVRNPY